MKVLLSAFACSPELGSEPGVGWGFVKQVAKRHEVWVLTASTNQAAIERELTVSPLSSLHFVFVEVPRGLASLSGSSRFHHVYYLFWQFQAFRIAKALHRTEGFDLVHHLTYVNSWLPSLMGWLGVPFLWSAGIKDRTPFSFIREMSWRSQIRELSRNALTALLGSCTHVITGLRASVILTSSARGSWAPTIPVIRCPMGALTFEEIKCLGETRHPPDHPFRVASIGRLMGLKGFTLGLRAFACIQRRFPSCEYLIIGNGPERKYLARLARDLGCDGKVRFVDWLGRGELFTLLGSVDVLIHPSLHEQFSYVILESMAAGIPVICLDVGGPSMLVDSEHGFKIPVIRPSQVVQDIYGALCILAEDPAARTRMGEKAAANARERWNWETAGEEIMSIYEAIRSGKIDAKTVST